jgi:hypothetical protein
MTDTLTACRMAMEINRPRVFGAGERSLARIGHHGGFRDRARKTSSAWRRLARDTENGRAAVKFGLSSSCVGPPEGPSRPDGLGQGGLDPHPRHPPESWPMRRPPPAAAKAHAVHHPDLACVHGAFSSMPRRACCTRKHYAMIAAASRRGNFDSFPPFAATGRNPENRTPRRAGSADALTSW